MPVVVEVLKQCPFCGGTQAKLQDGYVNGHTLVHGVVCQSCGAMGSWGTGGKEAAMQRWNKRVEEAHHG